MSAGFDDVGGFQGTSSEVQAAVAISVITDFTRPDELDTPFLLIAGEDDDLVLPAQSRRLHQRLLDAGHGEQRGPRPRAYGRPDRPVTGVINSRLADFFDRHLR